MTKIHGLENEMDKKLQVKNDEMHEIKEQFQNTENDLRIKVMLIDQKEEAMNQFLCKYEDLYTQFSKLENTKIEKQKTIVAHENSLEMYKQELNDKFKIIETYEQKFQQLNGNIIFYFFSLKFEI